MLDVGTERNCRFFQYCLKDIYHIFTLKQQENAYALQNQH